MQSRLTGFPVEMTVRGVTERGYLLTLSAEGDRTTSFEPVRQFLGATGQIADWSTEYVADIDFTCAFFEALTSPTAVGASFAA